jgi:hypothetical protein
MRPRKTVLSQMARLAYTFIGLVVLSGLALSSCGGATSAAASPTPTVVAATPTSDTASILASFVGDWHVHGAQLTIAADGTGKETWNAGPCGATLCAGNEDLTFTASADGTLTGTVAAVHYVQNDGTPAPSGFDPGSDAPRAGDRFTLRHVHSDLLIAAWLNRPDLTGADAGNPYWCGSTYSGPECGA